jgi:hypothetical protein
VYETRAGIRGTARGRENVLPVPLLVGFGRSIISRFLSRWRVSETQLRQEAERLVKRARTDTSLDDMLVDVFALVREVARRETRMRPFDVQTITLLTGMPSGWVRSIGFRG